MPSEDEAFSLVRLPRVLPDDSCIYEAVAEHTGDIIYKVTTSPDDPFQGRVDFVSPVVKRLLGYEPDDFVKDPELWFRSIHPADIAEVSTSTAQLIQSRKPVTRTYRLRKNSSLEYVWLEDQVLPQLDADGRLVGMIGSARDISRRRRLAEEARLEKERLDQIRASLPALLFSISSDGTVQDASGRLAFDTIEDLKFTGKSIFELLREHPQALALFHRAVSGETLHERVDFADRSFDLHLSPIEDEFGVIRGVTGLATDITPRVHLQQHLEAKTAEIQAINEAMGTFLLRNDLRASSQTILKAALDLTQSEYGFVGALVDSSLRVFAHEGFDWDPTIGHEFYVSALRKYAEDGYLEFTNFDNLFGRVISSGEAVISNDPGTDPRSGGRPPGHPPLRRFLGVPMRRGAHTLGMIGVANRKADYGEPERRALESFAQVASVLYDSYTRQQGEAKALDAVRSSEERFRTLADQARDVLFRRRFLPTPQMEYVSPAIEPLTGYTPEEFYADPGLGLRLVHPDDQAVYQQLVNSTVARPEATSLRLLHKDGTYRWVEMRTVTFLDEAGRVSAIEGIIRDITRERQWEDERRLLALAMEQTADNVFITDAENRFVYVNPAFEASTGYSRDDVLGENPSILASGRHSKRFYQRMLRTLAAGQPYRAVFINRKKNGELYHEGKTITPILDDTAKIIQYISVGRNLGDFMKAAELKQQLRVSEEAERLKTNLLSTVSHELRTPLAAIIGYATAVLDYGDRLGPERVRDYLQGVEKRGRQLERLIEDLLTMSRLDAGSMSLEPELLDLRPLLSEMVEEARFQTEFSIVLSLPKKPILANVDSMRLRQVVSNLVENAMKYSSPAGKIAISAKSAGSRIQVTVRDHGPGVDDDELDLIFTRFYRGRMSAAHPRRGTGLGLSICKSIVEAHGGSIHASLPRGGGLAVTFELPLDHVD